MPNYPIQPETRTINGHDIKFWNYGTLADGIQLTEDTIEPICDALEEGTEGLSAVIETLSGKLESECEIFSAHDDFLSGTIDDLKGEVDNLKAATDVIAVFANKSDFDTWSAGSPYVTENDFIKILVDDTHTSAQTYYQYVNGAWVFKTSLPAYYSTDDIDAYSGSLQYVSAIGPDNNNDINFNFKKSTGAEQQTSYKISKGTNIDFDNTQANNTTVNLKDKIVLSNTGSVQFGADGSNTLSYVSQDNYYLSNNGNGIRTSANYCTSSIDGTWRYTGGEYINTFGSFHLGKSELYGNNTLSLNSYNASYSVSNSIDLYTNDIANPYGLVPKIRLSWQEEGHQEDHAEITIEKIHKWDGIVGSEIKFKYGNSTYTSELTSNNLIISAGDGIDFNVNNSTVTIQNDNFLDNGRCIEINNKKIDLSSNATFTSVSSLTGIFNTEIQVNHYADSPNDDWASATLDSYSLNFSGARDSQQESYKHETTLSVFGFEYSNSAKSTSSYGCRIDDDGFYTYSFEKLGPYNVTSYSMLNNQYFEMSKRGSSSPYYLKFDGLTISAGPNSSNIRTTNWNNIITNSTGTWVSGSSQQILISANFQTRIVFTATLPGTLEDNTYYII